MALWLILKQWSRAVILFPKAHLNVLTLRRSLLFVDTYRYQLYSLRIKMYRCYLSMNSSIQGHYRPRKLKHHLIENQLKQLGYFHLFLLFLILSRIFPLGCIVVSSLYIFADHNMCCQRGFPIGYESISLAQVSDTKFIKAITMKTPTNSEP